MNDASRPIGIFDSGIGGLTVAKAIKETLPNEQIVYFGDTVHMPYGDKSSHAIKTYSKRITRFLLKQNCKAIVIACNSASTVASKLLSRELNIPVINVIDPTVEMVAKSKKSKVIGLIGTKKTVSSGVYAKRLKSLNPDLKLYSKATPLLAPMIEEGFFNNNISRTIIHSYLASSRLGTIDTLILGCTHYPLIKNEIAPYYEQPIHIIDSSIVTARALMKTLSELGILNKAAQKESDVFFVTDYTAGFEKAAQLFFGKQIKLKESRIFD